VSGRWTLRDDRLDVSLVVVGKPGTDAYRVHLEGDRLALWNLSIHLTTVYTRRGKRAELASSPRRAGNR
jgi:hypothetical protein